MRQEHFAKRCFRGRCGNRCENYTTTTDGKIHIYSTMFNEGTGKRKKSTFRLHFKSYVSFAVFYLQINIFETAEIEGGIGNPIHDENQQQSCVTTVKIRSVSRRRCMFLIIYIAWKYSRQMRDVYVHIVYFRNCYRKYRFSSLYVGHTTAVVTLAKRAGSIACYFRLNTHVFLTHRPCTPRCFPSSRNHSNIFLCSSSNFSLFHFILYFQCFHTDFEQNVVSILGTYLDPVSDYNPSIFNKEKYASGLPFIVVLHNHSPIYETTLFWLFLLLEVRLSN